jgi:hypothetical protein
MKGKKLQDKKNQELQKILDERYHKLFLYQEEQKILDDIRYKKQQLLDCIQEEKTSRDEINKCIDYFDNITFLDFTILIKHSQEPPAQPFYDEISLKKNIDSFMRSSRKYKTRILRKLLETNIFNGMQSKFVEFVQGECFLCAESFCATKKEGEFSPVFPICGNTGCDAQVCIDCAKKHYTPQIGCVCYTRNLCCPCCMRPPTQQNQERIFTGETEIFRDILEETRKKTFSSNWWYAWCVSCYELKECEMKNGVCGVANQEPNFNWFTCQECIDKTNEYMDKMKYNHRLETEIKARKEILQQENNFWNEIMYSFNQLQFTESLIKKCPNCNIPCMKDGGCNHYTCICGIHYCWICKFSAQTGNQIYKHLRLLHGGFFDNY